MQGHADLPPELSARRATPDDAAALVALSAEAGWNQTVRDWAAMLAFGAGFALFDRQRPAASAIALAYERAADGTKPVGFVSMVLVNAPWRRRGLASRLVRQCIAHLEAAGCQPVLDATPAGRLVYRGLGFVDGIALDRWRAERVGPAAALERGELALRPIDGARPEIAACDADALGARRAAVVAELIARRPDLAWAAWRGTSLAGFVLGRDGRTATHVGPVVAEDGAVAAALLDHALAHVEGPAVIDLARSSTGLAAMLAARGFVSQRGFTRMHRGHAAPPARRYALHAAAGPEFG